MRKTFMTLALASTMLTAACAGQAPTQEVTKAGEVSGGLFGLGTAADVDVTTGKAFAGVQEVVIGGFTVGFDINSTDSNKAGGGLTGSGFGGKSTAKSTLVGVSDSVMQQITDAAYNDFVAELKAKGYTVADRSSLTQHDDFKGTKTYPNPYEDTQGGLLGGGTTTKYFAPSSFGGVKLFGGEIPGTTGGFGFDNAGVGAAGFAEKAGKKVINAFYKIDFANASGHGGWASTTSSITVGQGISVAPGAKIGIIGGQGGTFSSTIGNITTGQPIVSEKAFANVEDATTDTYKAVQVATNVVGFIGGVGTNSSRNYEVKARPADYKAASLDAIRKTTDTLVGKMKELK